jgi:translocation and assembly module TamA
MILARSLRAALVALAVHAALCLAGCASLSSVFHGSDANAETSEKATTGATPAVALQAQYKLEVQAPDALRKLLIDYLDLARFQNAPVNEGINSAELDRLLRAAPSQARALLETEGYFNAEVTVSREQSAGGTSQEGALPAVRMVVTPGPRASVSTISIEAIGDLRASADAGDVTAVRELAALRSQWPLAAGNAFRQGAWLSAKNSTLARLRADGYAAATYSKTSANVNAPDNTVNISVVLDSGPLFKLGAIRIEGLDRYDEEAVRRLSTFSSGQPYSEKTLLDFQDRLQKIGLFQGASVELDADAKNAAAAPVIVRVKEQPLQQATVGVGYSADTGPRVSLEHTERRVFGSRWIATNKFELGPDQQTWEGELTSHPLDGLYRNLVSGSTTRLLADGQVVLGWNARLGRTQDTQRIERLYYGELTHSRVDGPLLASDANAASINYNWVFRDLDNVLLPTRGLTTSAQAGVGYARGSQTIAGDMDEAHGPFARLYARLTFYQPLGSSWYGTARVEAGEVFTHDVVGIPDPILFRAGGEDSVRGYGYRTLGPTTNGVTTSGLMLLTSSIELARPISANYPAYWWATFIDVGNAANRWADIKPDVGYGVGLRWRSPVGLLRADVAYGEQVKQVRAYFSVGIAF